MAMSDDDVVKKVDEAIQGQALEQKPIERLTELSEKIDKALDLPETPPLELEKLRAISESLIEPELAIHIVENAQSAIIVAKKNGCIYYINREAEFMFGYPRAELFDHPIVTLVPDRFKQGHLNGLAKWLLKPTLRSAANALNTVGRSKDGTEVPVTISILPVVIAAGFFIVAILRKR